MSRLCLVTVSKFLTLNFFVSIFVVDNRASLKQLHGRLHCCINCSVRVCLCDCLHASHVLCSVQMCVVITKGGSGQRRSEGKQPEAVAQPPPRVPTRICKLLHHMPFLCKVPKKFRSCFGSSNQKP